VSDRDFPHGKCECAPCRAGWCGGRGPAAYEVRRDGKVLRVCTKCTLFRDNYQKLLVKPGDPIEPFEAWDELGTMRIQSELQAAELEAAHTEAN